MDIESYFTELDNLPKRNFTKKLKLKKRISPLRVFKMFKKFLIEPKREDFFLGHSLTEENDFDNRIINSIQFSFEFDKKWKNTKEYISSIQTMTKEESFFRLNQYSILENLSKQEIKNIRSLFVLMQNERCFTNFNEMLVGKIITNNFICKNKNTGNSLSNNRKTFSTHFIVGSKNNSKYNTVSSDVKLHLIKKDFL